MDKGYFEKDYFFQTENGVPRVVSHYLKNKVKEKEKQQGYEFENMLSKQVFESFYKKIKNDPQTNIEEFCFPKFHLENIKELTLISPDSTKILLFSIVKENDIILKKRYLFDLKSQNIYTIEYLNANEERYKNRNLMSQGKFTEIMNNFEESEKYRKQLLRPFCENIVRDCLYQFEISNVYYNTYFWNCINEDSKNKVIKVTKLY